MSQKYETERLRILDMLGEGFISAEDAVQLLNALSGERSQGVAPARSLSLAPPPTGEPVMAEAAAPSSSAELPDEFAAQRAAFRHLWRYPLAAGVIVITASGLLIYQGYQKAAFGYWFYISWISLVLGLAVTILAFYSRKARWLHVRIQGNTAGEAERKTFSFPLPIRPAAWVIRRFGHWFPKLEKTSLDEVILALENNTSPDKPFYVEIQDKEAEERVQVFIG